MEDIKQLDNLTKGSGKGKTAAIIRIVNPMSFTHIGIKNVCVKIYKDYLEQYIGYDKVYIVSTSEKESKVNEEYFDKNSIIFGINKINILNDFNIDDIFCCQHALVVFGGVLKEYYFSMCNRLVEWYKVHGNGHYYTIQDDPDFITINPARFIERRLFVDENHKPKPYNYNKEHPDVKLYAEYKNTNLLNECFDNSIIAHCGENYNTYFERRTKMKFGYDNIVTKPKFWCKFNVYNWQGVNCNLDEKFKDYSLDRKYQSEYHGYVKTDTERIKTTLEFYNSLDGPVKIIEGKNPFSANFKNADKVKEIAYNDLFRELCKDSYSSFIIANSSTFGDFISPRYFDIMLSDIIAFVYTPYDAKKEYTDDEFLKEFMYVDTPDEFKKKVNEIVSNEKLFCKVKYLQRKSIYDKFKNYMTDDAKKKFEEYLSNNKDYDKILRGDFNKYLYKTKNNKKLF